jgi:transposase-like protein
MDKQKRLDAYILELGESLSQGKGLTGKDGILTPLIKEIIEASLEGELDHHIGNKPVGVQNRRNGRTPKNLKSSLGSIEIFTPRDRDGSFSPQTIPKYQRNLPGDIDEKIIGLYGLGMSYSDIQAHLVEIYGLSVSDGLINSITDRVIPSIREWQARPLERLYCILWMDAMHFKVRQDGKVITKAIYTVLGVNAQGDKEVLGLYLGDNESASFWLQVLTDLSQRGVEDILIASIDNLRGFSQAIESIYPSTEVQLCVIHQIRNTLRYVSWKDSKELMKDLKTIYYASSKELAEHNLDVFDEKWSKKYPKAVESWLRNWDLLSNFFKYPEPIRKLVYTTNTVEGYHRMVRKVTKSKGAFTSDMALMKLVYLATINFKNRWRNRIPGWGKTLNQLSIYFEDRILKSDTEF